ncbi:hypothetical protein HK101_003727 [Irineochytrium annulatum]|nr:hypothetical protein HK101_003727 [Irineochytrium annulatum]
MSSSGTDLKDDAVKAPEADFVVAVDLGVKEGVEQAALPTGKLDPNDPEFVLVPLAPVQFGLVFLGLALAILLGALDQTIVSTALRNIVLDFGGQDLIPWIGSAYLLSATSFSPLYGKFSDVFGRRSVFLFAIIIFEIGSAICGASTSMEMLIVGRGVAGIGGGGIFSLVLIIISDIVSIQNRGKYQGIVGAVFGLASVIGPVIGGAFADHISWRWCFYINLPVGAITVVTCVLFLRFPPPQGSVRAKIGKIDWLGSLCIFAAVSLLITPLQLGGTIWAWGSGQVIGCLVGSAVMFGVLAYVEIKVAKEPIIDPKVFQNVSVYSLLLTAVCLGAAFISVVYYIALFFQVVYGDSATQSGIDTFPLVVGLVIFSIGSGVILSKTGNYKAWLFFGGVVTTAGITLVSTLNASSSRVQLIFYLFIVGVGVGSLIQMRVLGLQASVDPPSIAIVTALSQFCQSLGGSLGVAVSIQSFYTPFFSVESHISALQITGTIFNNVLHTNIASKNLLSAFLARTGLGGDNLNLLLLRDILSASNQTELVSELIDSFAGAFGIAYKCALPFPILIFLLAFTVTNYTMMNAKKAKSTATEPVEAPAADV